MRKLAVPLALLLVAGLFLFFTRDTEPDLAPTPDTTAEAVEPTELVYREGTQLFVYDLASGEVTPGPVLPTKDVDVTLDGTMWAATSGVPDKRNPDPQVEPTEIIVGGVDDDSRKSIGIGYSPVWSPDGEELAAVFPVDGYLICPLDADPAVAQRDPAKAGCTEGERISIYSLDGAEPVPAIGAEEWRILGWMGGSYVVGSTIEGGQVKIGYAGAVDDEQTVVPVRGKDVLALSPTDPRLFVRTEAGGAITDDQANAVVTSQVQNLGSAYWSPDGKTIGVIALGPVLVKALTGEAAPIGAARPTSSFVWSADSSTIGYRQKEDAVVCAIVTQRCTNYQLDGNFELLAVR